MTMTITIGKVFMGIPINEGWDWEESDKYTLIPMVESCPKADHEICKYNSNEATCHLANHNIWCFFTYMIPDFDREITNYGDVSIMPIKPLMKTIEGLPNKINSKKLNVESTEIYESLIVWLKYWSAKSVELYDKSASIEIV